MPELYASHHHTHTHQARLAEAVGAERVFDHEPASEVVSGIAEAMDADPLVPWRGLPEYREAFMTCFDQGASGAVMGLFDRFE
jgi:hypothetical protein